MSNSNTQSENDSVLLSQAETDDLLETVSEQIALDTFDSNDSQVLQRLVECLGDPRGMTRLSCAQILGKIGEPATPILIEALAHHDNVVVRRAAAKTITLIADKRAIPQLLHSFLNDADTVVQSSSVGALARMGEAAVVPLLDILESPETPESGKGHAAWALTFIGLPAKPYLYRAMSNDSAAVRSAVVGAIAKIAETEPSQELFDILVNSLSDSDSDVRCEAAAVLANLRYPGAIANLIELLHHSDSESRRSAALALMKMGDPAAVDPLQTALAKESEPSVESIINLAISQLQP
ncbi:MAG: HEAT repeat domain-containing protein [Microcoleaceae cyanobacterium]